MRRIDYTVQRYAHAAQNIAGTMAKDTSITIHRNREALDFPRDRSADGLAELYGVAPFRRRLRNDARIGNRRWHPCSSCSDD